MGFGCHLDATISCQRALTELFQLIEIKDNNTSPFCFSDIPEESYLFGEEHSSVLQVTNSNSLDLKVDIEYCLAQLKKIDVDVIVINNTRASLALSSVKVIIPGLCHIFPYFGLNRLYQIPVKMGFFKRSQERIRTESVRAINLNIAITFCRKICERNFKMAPQV
jgi:ribosomal protein S12 methylthiotransferase accessory factor